MATSAGATWKEVRKKEHGSKPAKLKKDAHTVEPAPGGGVRFVCGVCEGPVRCTSKLDLQNHQRSKRHLAAWLERTGQRAPPPPAPEPAAAVPEPEPAAEPPQPPRARLPAKWLCGPCGKKFESDIALTLHNATPEHAELVNSSRMDPADWQNVFQCHVCPAPNTCSRNLQEHILGLKHKAALAARGVCDVCCLQMAGHAEFKAHCASPEHTQRAAQLEAGVDVPPWLALMLPRKPRSGSSSGANGSGSAGSGKAEPARPAQAGRTVQVVRPAPPAAGSQAGGGGGSLSMDEYMQGFQCERPTWGAAAEAGQSGAAPRAPAAADVAPRATVAAGVVPAASKPVRPGPPVRPRPPGAALAAAAAGQAAAAAPAAAAAGPQDAFMAQLLGGMQVAEPQAGAAKARPPPPGFPTQQQPQQQQPQQQQQQQAPAAPAATAAGGRPAGEQGLAKLLICPITRERMKDPVLASDGHTYERAAIEAWLRYQKVSPVTKRPIGDTNLVSNVLIKQALAGFSGGPPT